MLPDRVRKSGKVAEYNQVGGSLVRKRSGKAGLTGSGTCLDMTRVSARVKFQVTCPGMARVVTRVRHRVTRSGTTRVRSQAVSDKGLGKRPGKNSGKEAGQDETYKTRIFLCFRVNPS
jgi:hypothetical protein